MKPTHREDAKAQFVRDVMPPHFEYLRTNAYVMTGCRADAEDLVQETMLKAYVGLRTFEPGGNIRAWLHRIMSNVFVDNYRSAQRRPPTRLTGDVALMVTQSETAASRPERGRRRRMHLSRCPATCPTRCGRFRRISS